MNQNLNDLISDILLAAAYVASECADQMETNPDATVVEIDVEDIRELAKLIRSLDEQYPHLTSDAAEANIHGRPTPPLSAIGEATVMDSDELANAMIVTGAVWAALLSMPTVTKATPDGNTVTFRPEFMKSSYRATIERVAE